MSLTDTMRAGGPRSQGIVDSPNVVKDNVEHPPRRVPFQRVSLSKEGL